LNRSYKKITIIKSTLPNIKIQSAYFYHLFSHTN